MQVRLLLGPAGSGKTFRCLSEARELLAAAPEGPPLVWLAPKQSTYQLERQLLEMPEVPGYTRLQILSFERVAHFVFEALGLSLPDMLNDDGRVMVLRGLLASTREELKLFRASARLTGFAQQLGELFSELQKNQLTPDALRDAAAQVSRSESLALKLHDFAILLARYTDWLAAHRLQDSDSLLSSATNALAAAEPAPMAAPPATGAAPGFWIERLWVDGFAEVVPQQRELLAQLLPRCASATVTFCLDEVPRGKTPWLSQWSVVRRSFEQLKARLEEIPGADLRVEVMERRQGRGRFTSSPTLARLEQAQAGGATSIPRTREPSPADAAVRLVTCSDPEAEAVLAAREILALVRKGGRYRDATVLLRDLERYHLGLRRVFARYEIPLFVDRREVVSHHPLPELTRSALRTVAGGWQREDWFAALKTGLVPASEGDLDRLENEALARGWDGPDWLRPLTIPEAPEQTPWIRGLQTRLLPPFKKLALALGGSRGKFTGPELAGALADFWSDLHVERQLLEWAALEPVSADAHTPAVHATVWEEMNAWLGNVVLGFPEEALPLREWLPILEAGLASLTVGLIPPALDQVLIGTVDRSRSPQSRLVIVLGVNEGVFPARIQPGVLLTEADRKELEERGLAGCDTARQHLARERYYSYVAWTRACERLVITCAAQDENGAPLNPSPFFSELCQRFPEFPRETFHRLVEPGESVHSCELAVHVLRNRARAAEVRADEGETAVNALPVEIVEALYGRVLRTSVSRLEEYAECPFQFFMKSGLKAEERKRFELDVREQGSFQHDVLALFHQQLKEAGLRWRDITPGQARERIAKSAEATAGSYGHGLLQANEQARFLARVMTSILQDFAATLVGWMREQYLFDPVLVEWPFGRDESAPDWAIDLGQGHSLQLQGRIDRVDTCRLPNSPDLLCVIVDYKSGQKKLDPLLVSHGIQLQLLTYLNVLRHSAAAALLLQTNKLVPAGAFYVGLSGKSGTESTRTDALRDAVAARKLAYRHTGRFDRAALPYLDGRKGVTVGDQFAFRLTHSGEFSKKCVEPMPTAQFLRLLDSTADHIERMGREIFAGNASISPYRRGAVTPCNNCSYQAVCRIDTWTHAFRVLRKPETKGPSQDNAPSPGSTDDTAEVN